MGSTGQPTSAAERRIRILITGGTFDKEYDEINGQLFFKDFRLPEMLTLGRCNVEADIRTLMMVDSLEMIDADRDLSAVPMACLTWEAGWLLCKHFRRASTLP